MKNTQEVKIRYRMYKKGKHWVFASITATTIAIGAFTFTGLSASAEESTSSETTTADETQTQPIETQVQTTTTEPVQAQSQETTTQPTQAQSQETTTQPAQAQSQETTTQPTQAQSQETTTQPAQAQSQETTTQPAQTQSQTTVAQPAPTPTTAKKPAATVTKNVAKAAKNYATATKKAAKTNVTKAVAATPKPTSAKTVAKKAVAKTAAVTTNSIPTEVTKENFNDAFRLNGSATYEKNDGVVTLTPDVDNQSGNFALKNKIDLSKSFTLEGRVNLGDKSMNEEGADGIGFAFHNGDTNTVGMSGGALGIGNLVDAFGFKLDTFYNGGTVNGSKNEFFHGDPNSTKGKSFGAFTYTKLETVPKEKGNSYSGTQQYYAYTDADSAKSISHPSDNKFKDIIFNYNGDTKIMTITYEGKEWKENITKWKNKNVDAYSFIVSGSTGGFKNLQQFEIKSFTYTAAGMFTALFKEEGTNTEIANKLSKDGEQGKSLDVANDVNTAFKQLFDNGYDYVKSDIKTDKTTEYQETKNPDGTFSSININFDNTPSEATYFFKKADGSIIVKHIDQDGNNLKEETSTKKKVGDSYTTTEDAFEGYRFVRVSPDSASTSGLYTRDTQTIIYQYQATSVVDFLFLEKENEDNPTPIADSFTKKGDEKATEIVKGDVTKVLDALYEKGYDLVSVTPDQENMYDKDTQTITYVKNDGTVTYTFEKAKGIVTVKYQDEDGNKIEKTATIQEKVGKDYSTTPKDIPGFTLIPEKTQGSTSGILTREEQTVIYVYKKEVQPAKDAALTVHYVDIDTNEELSPSQTLPGKEGDKLPDTSKSIPDYTFVKTDGVTDGNFVAGDQSITHYYKKNNETPPVVEPPVVEPPVVEPPVVEPPVVEPPVVEPPVVEPPVVEPPVVEPPVVEPPVVEPPVVEPPVVEPPVVEPPKETENTETPVTPPDTTPEEETTQENPPSNSDNEQSNEPNSPVAKPNNPVTVVQVSNPPKASTVTTTTPVVQPASSNSNTPTLQNPAQASMLPQTGDAATQTGLMGGMLLALSALAGVLGLRKRKTEK